MTTVITGMRDQMVATLNELVEQDERLAVLLAGISEERFQAVRSRYPERIVNVGILEQALIGIGAGFALEGLIPVTHSITPFLIERPFEMLKLDFCYQGLQGNFIGIGASYDYSTEGMTHHGPGDVQILSSLPGMQIVVPGSAVEFDRLFRQAYANGSPTYYRLSERANSASHTVDFGKIQVIRSGNQATVIAVGPLLDRVLTATEGLDLTLLYCTTISPFDAETLRQMDQSGKIILVEPYYEGVLVPEIAKALAHKPIRVQAIGVPHKILTNYGKLEQHDHEIGLTPKAIHDRIEAFI